jgi:hypothetical protein
MTKIVGFKHVIGVFTPEGSNREIPYDNIMLHYVFDRARDVVGFGTGIFKIKFERCKEITGFDYGELPQILNKSVDFKSVPNGAGFELDEVVILDDAKADSKTDGGVEGLGYSFGGFDTDDKKSKKAG